MLLTILCTVIATAQSLHLDEQGFFEGDIILTDEQRQSIMNQGDGREYYRAVGNILWPGGILYYEFARGEFSGRQATVIMEAMSDIERSSCVKFRPRPASIDAYVRFRNTGQLMCASHVGFVANGRGVDMYLSGEGCLTRGTIQHELLHALGFWHEHTRPDRDQHINILWQNIQPGKEFNFMKRPIGEEAIMVLPYDYGSVMHYRPVAFSKDRRSATITTRDKRDARQMGQRIRFSSTDLAKLNRLYNCPYPYYKGNEIISRPSITGKY